MFQSQDREAIFPTLVYRFQLDSAEATNTQLRARPAPAVPELAVSWGRSKHVIRPSDHPVVQPVLSPPQPG